MDGGRLADRSPALELGQEIGLLLLPKPDRVLAEQEMRRRIVALDHRDHRLRRLGRIAGLVAVAAVEIGFDRIDDRAIGVDAAAGPHVRRAGEFGAEGARRDDGDGDPEWLDLVPQRLAPAFEREFDAQ